MWGGTGQPKQRTHDSRALSELCITTPFLPASPPASLRPHRPDEDPDKRDRLPLLDRAGNSGVVHSEKCVMIRDRGNVVGKQYFPRFSRKVPISIFASLSRYRRPSDEELKSFYSQREVDGWQRYVQQRGPQWAPRMAEAGITNLAQFYTSEFKYRFV